MRYDELASLLSNNSLYFNVDPSRSQALNTLHGYLSLLDDELSFPSAIKYSKKRSILHKHSQDNVSDIQRRIEAKLETAICVGLCTRRH
jgi:hypothetical protein